MSDELTGTGACEALDAKMRDRIQEVVAEVLNGRAWFETGAARQAGVRAVADALMELSQRRSFCSWCGLLKEHANVELRTEFIVAHTTTCEFRPEKKLLDALEQAAEEIDRKDERIAALWGALIDAGYHRTVRGEPCERCLDILADPSTSPAATAEEARA